MNADVGRRGVLRGAGAAAGIGALGAAGALGAGAQTAHAAPATGGPYGAVSGPSPGAAPGPGFARLFTSPVIGTWRGTVSRSDGEVEQTLLGFYPGGMFTAFTDGHHVAVGTWAPRHGDRVTFGFWQVLPFDLKGQPNRYHGEVRALHQARVNGDGLTSRGLARALDLDGNVLESFDIDVEATRYGLTLPDGPEPERIPGS